MTDQEIKIKALEEQVKSLEARLTELEQCVIQVPYEIPSVPLTQAVNYENNRIFNNLA